MKHNQVKICMRVIAFLLAVVMFSSLAISTFAVEKTSEKQYVKDVKLIYAESKEEAKKSVPKGYIFLEQNLNEGTDEDSNVYFIYSTTTLTLTRRSPISR